MTDRSQGIRNWRLLGALVALLAIGGLAIGQESQPPADTPGTDDSERDLGPRWQREDAEGWEPGDKGPPPWANPRFHRDDAEGWSPGDGGPPPWAGKDDNDE